MTGGARGIGARVAAVLAEAGATVIVADIDYTGAQRTAAAFVEGGLAAHAVCVDVSDESSVMAFCVNLVSEHGTPWLLVNNAGLQDREVLFKETVAQWDRINAVNARGAFLMTRELGQAMAIAGGGGRIVNIASNVLRGSLIKGEAAYAASKGALLALSSVSAFELSEHAITVNTILPGSVFTPGSMGSRGPQLEGPALRQAPFGLVDGRQIGTAVLFFALPISRGITNQALAVDAGFSIS
ncbi:SDR family NAD(P)-dependent oxidoreductase [Mycobacterium yunnanensis]|uniref:SDR family NAD(P)-dependent oxidoreductase n=1 Tax=Mycobacterium yunnanensis TaxID=368477 RepID=UPI0021F2E442|nr:SDR family oxidoreductase [Mycobacterium yunnanensis]